MAIVMDMVVLFLLVVLLVAAIRKFLCGLAYLGHAGSAENKPRNSKTFSLYILSYVPQHLQVRFTCSTCLNSTLANTNILLNPINPKPPPCAV